jgi:hypothetical protein
MIRCLNCANVLPSYRMGEALCKASGHSYCQAETRQQKAMRLASHIRKVMYRKLGEEQLFSALHLLQRFNAVYQTAYPAEHQWTPGKLIEEFLDEMRFRAML